jgi:hypothetical protein
MDDIGDNSRHLFEGLVIAGSPINSGLPTRRMPQGMWLY